LNLVRFVYSRQRGSDSTRFIRINKVLVPPQINQKGSEQPLALAFDKMVTGLGNGMVK